MKTWWDTKSLAKELGMSIRTLRRWLLEDGCLHDIPRISTKGGTHDFYYIKDLAALRKRISLETT